MRNELSVNADGINISYEDSGKNTVPVIFIHGFPFNKSAWHPQFDFLRETQRVIIYDLPGFGNSGSVAGGTKSIHAFAENLVKFMDALNIKKAFVCGLSMGGYILLNAVERHQERFEGIILADTQCLADSKENAEKRFKTIVDIEKKGLKEFAEGFVKNAFAPDTLETNRELVDKIREVILSNSQEAVTSALLAMANRAETCSAIKNIQVPAMVLCGEEDALTPVSLSEFLFNHIPNAELDIIKRAGHLSNLERSEEFNDHLHNFISDIIE